MATLSMSMSIHEEPMDFSNHKLIRIHPRSTEHVKQLNRLEKEFQMDYWRPALNDLRPVLTIVDPYKEQYFLRALNNSKIFHEIVSNNFQRIVDKERAEMEMASRQLNAKGENYDYENSYHNYEEILDQMKYLANNHPEKAKYQPVGKTYEGREIPALVIGSGEKVIILENGIHSREWITIAFGQWVANKLITDVSLEPLLENYRFIVVPVLNVDGFIYTHTTNRLWRKTRSPSPGTNCFGADPNRNWDSHFCEQGASNNPCSETYCGSSAFSEIESKNMANLINQYKGSIAAYFAVHSYSQLWMYPFGYSYSLPPNAQQLKTLSQAAVSAIKKSHGLSFTEGSIANTIYLASGSSIDWAYDSADVKVAFAVELRDKGLYGFQLPANQIKPAVEETWAGVKAVIDQLS
ncbi:hypothetical protein RDWZM_010221 [Blomia tropicalis]|uniref:Peptidase M14 domain-containing protein n=1 Tax=Blomia tropicalis TaxID=40697 RepID=A0A9Q0RIJ2_BLOTA|nr:hypothetical protein RDWZM_010221 [Blomia tropicalis]